MITLNNVIEGIEFSLFDNWQTDVFKFFDKSVEVDWILNLFACLFYSIYNWFSVSFVLLNAENLFIICCTSFVCAYSDWNCKLSTFWADPWLAKRLRILYSSSFRSLNTLFYKISEVFINKSGFASSFQSCQVLYGKLIFKPLKQKIKKITYYTIHQLSTGTHEKLNESVFVSSWKFFAL